MLFIIYCFTPAPLSAATVVVDEATPKKHNRKNKAPRSLAAYKAATTTMEFTETDIVTAGGLLYNEDISSVDMEKNDDGESSSEHETEKEGQNDGYVPQNT